MGMGAREDENPTSEEEQEPEKQRLRPVNEEGMELQKIPVKVKDADYPEIIPHAKREIIKTSHLRYLIIGFNIIIAILGLVILSLAIWIRVDQEFWQYEKTLNIEGFYNVCYMFMFAGLVMITVAFVGCCGAITENQWMLIGYFSMFAVIFIVEFAAVVIIMSAPHNKAIKKEMEDQILLQIKKRESDELARLFTDFLQENLECCGSTSPKDYTKETPNSCLNTRTGSNYLYGCGVKMVHYLKTKAGIVAGVALPILLLQLLALGAAACLIRNIRRESRYVM